MIGPALAMTLLYIKACILWKALFSIAKRYLGILNCTGNGSVVRSKDHSKPVSIIIISVIRLLCPTSCSASEYICDLASFLSFGYQ